MRKVPLARMRQFCARLGDPQRRYRTILVGGSSGKGSICVMIAAIARAAGLRVGLYVSPHIQDVRERIQVGASHGERYRWIGKEELAALVARVQPLIEQMRTARGGPVTYFEAVTALAFLHFAQQRVSLAVLEVGLGGRLDATNVVEPVVSVIGPIGLDHQDVLGRTLSAIAAEKAGIMRPGRPVLVAPQPLEALAQLRQRADSLGARWCAYGSRIQATVLAQEPRGQRVRIQGVRALYEDIAIPLIGAHQAENAALAVSAVEWLAEDGAPYAAVREGLARVRWPGRLEVVQEDPVVLLDGAHNPPSIDALREALALWWPQRPVHLVLGMSADKASPSVVKAFARFAVSVTCTQSAHPRACDAQVLLRRVGRACSVKMAIADPRDAYTYVLNTSAATDVMVVTGSLFLVGQLRAALRRGATPAHRAVALR
jgi:dihydrofolate synthase/folylpolyglutamate synthase